MAATAPETACCPLKIGRRDHVKSSDDIRPAPRPASKIDWDWIDHEIAPLYSDKGRLGIETRA